MTAEPKEYEQESPNSGAPKNFIIRCPRCRWARLSSGVAVDIKDLVEVNPGCKTCGKWRKFRCPKCGMPSTMRRLRGNS